MTAGRSLELYFVDGRPDGMLTAEVFNWTGHVLRIPRTSLVEGLKRPEAAQTGVYLLIGQDDDGPLAYVGEAETMADRVKQHASQKDWWEQVVMVTTAGDALHKAHVKYLESRLVELALDAGQIRLENGNAPPRSSLNEAATANMESFLSTLQMVLPAIRVDVLASATRPIKDASDAPPGATAFVMKNPKRGFFGTVDLIGGEFVLRKGARMRPFSEIPASVERQRIKRHALIDAGKISVKEGFDELLEPLAFNSPSGVSDFVLGTTTSGPKELRHPETGRTYAEWEADQLKGTDI